MNQSDPLPSRNTGFSRRSFLLRTAAATLAAGFWPGSLAAADAAAGEAGDFDFIAVNDLHFADPRLCPQWFETAFKAMKTSAPQAEFVLVSGDITMKCTKPEFSGMREAFECLRLPVHVVPGNHDVTAEGDHSLYENYFPKKVNYLVEHRGWQFVCINSAEARRAENTNVPKETLHWLDNNLSKLDPRKPTVLSTHYPLGPGIVRRPQNTTELLKKFSKFNLQSVFNGHWHGFTESRIQEAVTTTDRCCSRIRLNHDGSPLKGWFHCKARAGKITRQFVCVPDALLKDPGKPY